MPSVFCLIDKRRNVWLLSLLFSWSLHASETTDDHAHDASQLSQMVILDDYSIKNLQLKTVEAEEARFETTLFAMGTIEAMSDRKAIVSSRISGKAHSVMVKADQKVLEGDEVIWVESRMAGDPPPTVRIDAPIDGTIAKVNIALGQPIEPEMALIEIVNLDQVEAVLRIPQHQLSQLKLQQKARIRVQGIEDRIFEAQLAHLGAYADADSGTLEASFHIKNEDHFLRPGMRIEAHLIIEERPAENVIPRSALQGDAVQRFVYVKDFDLPNAFIKTPVVVGAMNDQVVEIVEGLLPADEVVTSGAYALAFAGSGTLSLKEALDAAHGHEHNEDGSEKIDNAITESEGSSQSLQMTPVIWFLSSTCILLLVLLCIAVLTRRQTSLTSTP